MISYHVQPFFQPLSSVPEVPFIPYYLFDAKRRILLINFDPALRGRRMRASIIMIGFWCILYYNYKKELLNMVFV